VNGSLAQHEAQLVAHGFPQNPSINYDKIFSLVIKMIYLWILIALIAIYKLEIHQMDVNLYFRMMF
jgi:hypothetical protein